VKENSIEEDIKLLEEFSNENVLYGSTVGMTLEKYKDLQLSTEHILSDYKRVLQENEYMHNELDKQQTKINKYAKENEELKSNNEKYIIHLTDEQYKTVIENAQNDINQKLIQKVKDKIEELDIAILECEYSDDDSEEYKKEVEKDKLELLKQKSILQELL
jgi:hypothetical protein